MEYAKPFQMKNEETYAVFSGSETQIRANPDWARVTFARLFTGYTVSRLESVTRFPGLTTAHAGYMF